MLVSPIPGRVNYDRHMMVAHLDRVHSHRFTPSAQHRHIDMASTNTASAHHPPTDPYSQTRRAIPARPQPPIAALLQFTGEPEAADERRLGHTPGIIAGHGLRDASVAQRGAHGAQQLRTGAACCAHGACSHLGNEPLGGHAIYITLRAVAEDLAERCRHILGGTRRDAAHGLGHQRAG